MQQHAERGIRKGIQGSDAARGTFILHRLDGVDVGKEVSVFNYNLTQNNNELSIE